MSNKDEKDTGGLKVKSPSLEAITPIEDVDDIILDEHRRSPQFIYVQEKVKSLPPPGKVQLDKFNWTHGRFRDEGVPMWMSSGMQILLASVMVLGPMILVYGKLIPNTYPLFSMISPVKPDILTEILRFILFIGCPLFIYTALQAVICFIPWFTYSTYKASRTEVHEILRTKIEELLHIRVYFGYAVSGIILVLVSQLLYPYPVPVSDSGEKKVDLSINSVIGIIQGYLQKPYQYYVSSFSFGSGVISIILLLEKLMILYVGRKYHSHGLANRIQTNKFGRKVTKSLKDYFLKMNPELKSKNWDDGMIIYQTIGKEKIGKEDFHQYMDDHEADRYFMILDPDNAGSLTQDEFLSAIDNLFIEQSAIDRAFLDQTRIVGRFDSLLMIFVYFIGFVILWIAFDPSIQGIVVILFGFSGSMAFVFQDTARSAFNSIVFVLFTHPFDADDSIIVDNVLYIVHELGLWVSSYITTSGQLVYIPNKSLVGKPIINLRRSPIMTEMIMVSVLPTVSKDKVKNLEAKLLEYLRANSRDYVPSIFVRGCKITDHEHMTLEFALTHRSNFNDQVKKDFRTRKFVLHLRECLEQLKIELSPPLRS